MENHQIHNDVDSLTGICCGAIVMCILILRSTHKGILNGKLTTEKRVRRAFNYFSRTIFVVAHWFVAYRTFHDHSPEVYSHDRYLYFHAAITALSVIIEVCLTHFLPNDGTKKNSHHPQASGGPHNLTPYEDNDSTEDISPKGSPDDLPLHPLSDLSPSLTSSSEVFSSSIDDDSETNPMQGLE